MTLTQEDQNKPSRGFICTFNVENSAGEKWKWPTTLPYKVKLMVGQLEKGESGNVHYQFYLQTTDSTTWRKVKQRLGLSTVHVEPAKNPSACKIYVTKAETRVEGPFQLDKTNSGKGKEEDDIDYDYYHDQIMRAAEERMHWPIWEPPCFCNYGIEACSYHYRLHLEQQLSIGS